MSIAMTGNIQDVLQTIPKPVGGGGRHIIMYVGSILIVLICTYNKHMHVMLY